MSAALHTDLYQLTMAAGYFAAGKVADTAIFELFVRRLPEQRRRQQAAVAHQTPQSRQSHRRCRRWRRPPPQQVQPSLLLALVRTLPTRQ